MRLRSARQSASFVLLLLASGIVVWGIAGKAGSGKIVSDQYVPAQTLVRQARPSIPLRILDDDGIHRSQCPCLDVEILTDLTFKPVIHLIVPTITGKDLLTFVGTRRE